MANTYFDQQISKAPGGSSFDNFKQNYMDKFNIVGDPGDLMNLGGTGYQTAAQAAKDAQTQANALSALQWQRQMQGLQGAMGYVGGLQNLYNSIYGGAGGHAAPGGVAMTPQAIGGPTQAQQMALSAPPQATAPAASGSGGGSLTDLTKKYLKYDPTVNTATEAKKYAGKAYDYVKGLF